MNDNDTEKYRAGTSKRITKYAWIAKPGCDGRYDNEFIRIEIEVLEDDSSTN